MITIPSLVREVQALFKVQHEQDAEDLIELGPEHDVEKALVIGLLIGASVPSHVRVMFHAYTKGQPFLVEAHRAMVEVIIQNAKRETTT